MLVIMQSNLAEFKTCTLVDKYLFNQNLEIIEMQFQNKIKTDSLTTLCVISLKLCINSELVYCVCSFLR